MRWLGIVLLFLGAAACTRVNPLADGELMQKNLHFEKAIDAYRTFYRQNPFDDEAPEALVRIGNIYRLDLKEYKKAADAYGVLINRFPKSSQARSVQMILGDLFARHLGNHEQAVVEYQKVVAGDYSKEEKTEAIYRTANSYFALGNYAQARIEYRKLKDNYPDTLLAKRATLQIAHSLDIDGNCSMALPFFKEASAYEGTQEKEIAQEARFGTASCLEQQDDFKGAAEILEGLRKDYQAKEVVEIRLRKVKQRLGIREQGESNVDPVSDLVGPGRRTRPAVQTVTSAPTPKAAVPTAVQPAPAASNAESAETNEAVESQPDPAETPAAEDAPLGAPAQIEENPIHDD